MKKRLVFFMMLSGISLHAATEASQDEERLHVLQEQTLEAAEKAQQQISEVVKSIEDIGEHCRDVTCREALVVALVAVISGIFWLFEMGMLTLSANIPGS